jgi:hypothetical protein
MTPDEMSDLAECLADACREAERRGFTIGMAKRDMCPLGALILGSDADETPHCPTEDIVDAMTGMGEVNASNFTHGFDVGLLPSTYPLRVLGAQFRDPEFWR